MIATGRVFSLEFSDVNSVSLDRLLQQKAISLKNEVKAIRKIIPALQEVLHSVFFVTIVSVLNRAIA